MGLNIKNLDMHQSPGGPFLPYIQKGKASEVMAIMKVDDSVIVVLDEILEIEDERSKAFLCKQRRHMEKQQTKLIGAELSPRLNGAVWMKRTELIADVVAPTTKNRFLSQRAPAQYILVNCRPEIYAAV